MLTDALSDAETEVDSDCEADVDSLSEADSELDTDCDSLTDALSEADSEFDSDCDADVDSLSEVETEFDSVPAGMPTFRMRLMRSRSGFRSVRWSMRSAQSGFCSRNMFLLGVSLGILYAF